MSIQRLILLGILLVFPVCGVFVLIATANDVSSETSDSTKHISFRDHVMPILRQNCLACHRDQEADGGLSLETVADIIKGGDSGAAVVSGDPGASLLLERVTGQDDSLMPPEDNTVGAVALTSSQIQLLKGWINQGAAEESQPAVEMQFQWQPIPETVRSIASLDIARTGFVAMAQANRVLLVDSQTQREVARLSDPDLEGAVADVDLIQAVAFSPDGNRLATGGFRTVRVWQPSYQVSDAALAPIQHAAGLVAVSKDQSHHALVNVNGEIEVWDLAKSERQCKFRVSDEEVSAIEWLSGDSRETPVLLIVDYLGGLHLRDANGRSVSDSVETMSSIRKIALSENRGKLAVIHNSGEISTFNIVISDADNSVAIEAAATSIGDLKDVTAIAFDERADLSLIVATQSGGLQRVILSSGEVTALANPESVVQSIAVVADPPRWITGGRSGKTQVWNATDGKLLQTLSARGEDVFEIESAQRAAERQEISHQHATDELAGLEKRVVSESAAAAELSKQLDTATQELDSEMSKELPTADQELSKANELRKQKHAVVDQLKTAIASAESAKQRLEDQVENLKKRVQVVSLRSRALRQRVSELQTRSDAAASAVASLAGVPNSTKIAVMHADGAVRIMDVANPDSHAMVLPSSADLKVASSKSKLCFLRGQVICASPRTSPRISRVDAKWELQRVIGGVNLQVIADRVTSLEFHPDGRRLAIGGGRSSRSGEIKLVDVETGEILEQEMHSHSDTVMGLAFSPDGRVLASASADETIGLSEVSTGKTLRVLEGHTRHVLAIDWHDDGRSLVSASADQTVRVWDAGSGETTRKIEGFPHELTSVKFVGKTNQFAVACGSGEVRLCDSANGRTVRSFNAGDKFLLSVAVDSNLQRIVAGASDGDAPTWNVGTGAETGSLLVGELK
ncbi:hypothetical protein N9N28_05985 [Rubripirellula amarantea]|nr:hypothetical protein [Rubripirellula amarantea]